MQAVDFPLCSDRCWFHYSNEIPLPEKIKKRFFPRTQQSNSMAAVFDAQQFRRVGHFFGFGFEAPPIAKPQQKVVRIGLLGASQVNMQSCERGLHRSRLSDRILWKRHSYLLENTLDIYLSLSSGHVNLPRLTNRERTVGPPPTRICTSHILMLT